MVVLVELRIWRCTLATKIDRLEQLLRLWETTCFLGSLQFRKNLADEGVRLPWDNIKARSQPAELSPYGHWQDFRRYLLKFRGTGFDAERFIDVDDWTRRSFEQLAMVPALLAAWTAWSRQVFRLDANLQVLFEMTSVSELTWADVPWPFDAFAVMLDRPLVDEKDGTTFDCMLLTRRVYAVASPHRQWPNLSIMLLDTRLADYPQLGRPRRQRLERLAEARRWSNLDVEVRKEWLTYHPRRIRLPLIEMFCPAKERIVDLLDQFDQHRSAEKAPLHPLHFAMRLAVGLSIYLAMLPPRSPQVRWEPDEAPRDPEIRAITSGAHVCTVLNSHTLTAEEQHSLDSHSGLDRFRQLSPHWRRGHFRREPGQGQNPNAPRSIWVRPTLVRKDLVKPGTQVGGAQVDVE